MKTNRLCSIHDYLAYYPIAIYVISIVSGLIMLNNDNLLQDINLKMLIQDDVLYRFAVVKEVDLSLFKLCDGPNSVRVYTLLENLQVVVTN
jgi:hypothetical protein